ncbi:hypothetical protein OG478_12955 [Streptomyces phaeochromogenes]|uniref:hypothetical protein n=1 Tax=Streptomyces phaeochromogenes TaxID=1923 RepID=UPI00386828C3|nr:hypothetical protein OG478_12955 [Streptomyces phaeochromogenes]
MARKERAGCGEAVQHLLLFRLEAVGSGEQHPVPGVRARTEICSLSSVTFSMTSGNGPENTTSTSSLTLHSARHVNDEPALSVTTQCETGALI